jgi:hypothetical protein
MGPVRLGVNPKVLVIVSVVPQTKVAEGEGLRPRIGGVWEGTLVAHVVNVKHAASLGENLVPAYGVSDFEV